MTKRMAENGKERIWEQPERDHTEWIFRWHEKGYVDYKELMFLIRETQKALERHEQETGVQGISRWLAGDNRDLLIECGNQEEIAQFERTKGLEDHDAPATRLNEDLPDFSQVFSRARYPSFIEISDDRTQKILAVIKDLGKYRENQTYLKRFFLSLRKSFCQPELRQKHGLPASNGHWSMNAKPTLKVIGKLLTERINNLRGYRKTEDSNKIKCITFKDWCLLSNAISKHVFDQEPRWEIPEEGEDLLDRFSTREEFTENFSFDDRNDIEESLMTSFA